MQLSTTRAPSTPNIWNHPIDFQSEREGRCYDTKELDLSLIICKSACLHEQDCDDSLAPPCVCTVAR